MKLEWIGLSILITNVVTFFGIVGGVIAIIKYLLSLKQELSNVENGLRKELSEFKVESKTEMADFKTEVRIELVKLQARFDKYDGVNTDLEKRIAEIQKEQQALGQQTVQLKAQVLENQNQTNAKLLQMETDNKSSMKELFQSVEGWIKRPPVL